MRLSGVDPGIIRELSGIYKPFIKAFKELISNSYDADASVITVSVDPDRATVEVHDDGIGMNPYEFQQDFTRLGGSSAWLRGGKSPRGRERIGYKGIGFLAVARYCGQLHVESRTTRSFNGSGIAEPNRARLIRFRDLMGDLIPSKTLEGRVAICQITPSSGGASLKEGRDYEVVRDGVAIKRKGQTAYKVDYEVDCRQIVLRATLDFDNLLGLEHRADLRVLDEFCSVSISTDREPVTHSYTRIRLQGVKEFVVRELCAPAFKGRTRNIAFKSGRDQFLWRLARTAPIRSSYPEELLKLPAIKALAAHEQKLNLPELRVVWRDEKPQVLTRTVYEPTSNEPDGIETIIPIQIREKGLRANGYLMARSEVIFPAEFRGLSIRVRNVAIGDSSFLGWENMVSGPRKAALSQITGEVVVLAGLEAADAINPGRESFYEENAQYRTLKRVLFGTEGSIGGLVGEAIQSIMDRISVRSQVLGRIGDARGRRKTLTDISSAVGFYSRTDFPEARGLANFFSMPIEANGLAQEKDVPLKPRQKIAGFDLEEASGLGAEYAIDYAERRVRIDFAHDAWDTTVYLNGKYYDVLFKNGKPDQPICEFDNERRRIYVNWNHPVKTHMEEVGFLRSAILLRLAYHAAEGDANAMMNLALKMLAHRAE